MSTNIIYGSENGQLTDKIKTKISEIKADNQSILFAWHSSIEIGIYYSDKENNTHNIQSHKSKTKNQKAVKQPLQLPACCASGAGSAIWERS